MRMRKGTWKKERAVQRKFSGGDEHGAPKAHRRKQYWVGAYRTKKGKRVAGHFRSNPYYRPR